jgi:hypothetical protein
VSVSQVVEANAWQRLVVRQQLVPLVGDGSALVSAIGISPLTRLRIAETSRRTLSASMMKPVEHLVFSGTCAKARCSNRLRSAAGEYS